MPSSAPNTEMREYITGALNPGSLCVRSRQSNSEIKPDQDWSGGTTERNREKKSLELRLVLVRRPSYVAAGDSRPNAAHRLVGLTLKSQ
jgi:hypothetical protein